VFLVVVSYAAAAQLALPYGAPWVLPYTKLITTPKVETELKTVSLASPYLHPYHGLPYAHALPYGPFFGAPVIKAETDAEEEAVVDELKTVSLATPYLHPSQGLPYDIGFTYPHVFPYGPFFGAPVIKTEATAEEETTEEEPAVEEVRRRRRDVDEVSVPLPYVHAVPAVAKATVETKQFEAVDAATPADTTKIELTTKEHEINVPAVKYVQPTLKYKPITYKTVSPFTYAHGFPYAHGLTYSHGLPFGGYPYGPFVGAPVIKVDEE